MKRRDSKENKRPPATEIVQGEIPTSPSPVESLTTSITVKANKRGRRAVRNTFRKQAVQDILDKLRPQIEYPAWYLIGAILFLCNHFFASETMKILASNLLEKTRWCTVVRKFTHACLLWAQEPGYGPSLDDLNSAFDRLAKLSLINLEKAFCYVDQWPSNPLIKKIFQFKIPKEAPKAPGDLFKLVMLNKMNDSDKPLWIQLEECCTLQIGLKICWSEKHDFDDILAPFTTYRPSVLTFKTVVEFWTWWHESAQVKLFSGLKWNSPAHNSLIKLGKTNLEEQFPAVYAEDVTTPITKNADVAREESSRLSVENVLIDLTSTPPREDIHETSPPESMPKKIQTERRKSTTDVPEKIVRSKKSLEKNQPTKRKKSASTNTNVHKKTGRSKKSPEQDQTTKRKKSTSTNGLKGPDEQKKTYKAKKEDEHQ